MTCPFCTLPPARIVKENDLAMLIRDAYPVSPGDTYRFNTLYEFCDWFDDHILKEVGLVLNGC